MVYSINLLSSAESDVLETIDWYNAQESGLGFEFANDLEQTFQKLATNPQIYQVIYKKVRKVNLEKFKHQVFYRLNKREKALVIFAVLHAARDTKLWKTRL